MHEENSETKFLSILLPHNSIKLEEHLYLLARNLADGCSMKLDGIKSGDA